VPLVAASLDLIPTRPLVIFKATSRLVTVTPYRRPPITNEAASAIEDVVRWQLEVTRHERERRQAAVMRASAVTRALQLGASQNEIATSLGITGEAVRLWGTNSSELEEIDAAKRRLEELISALIDMRGSVVSYLAAHGRQPDPGTTESTKFVGDCDRILMKLDVMGEFAGTKLAQVRGFAAGQIFSGTVVNQCLFEAQQALRQVGK
jgi:hypothetical protein